MSARSGTSPPGHGAGSRTNLAPLAAGLGLEKVSVRVRTQDTATGEIRGAVLDVENVADRAVTVRVRQPADRPIRPLTEYKQKLLRAQRIGAPYPYELIRMLTPPVGAEADLPAGEFIEHDLDDTGDQLIPVDRPYGRNECRDRRGGDHQLHEAGTRGHDAGWSSSVTRRWAWATSPRRNAGASSARSTSPATMHVPVEWFALSSGARIAWDSGTENMDWIAAVLRRLIEFTQSGGEVNIVVTGINVGAQPYWDAEATMLMHTRGILIMTPASAMVLTGQEFARLLGRGIRRGQHRHRRLRKDHGPERAGAVLGTNHGRRLRAAAAATTTTPTSSRVRCIHAGQRPTDPYDRDVSRLAAPESRGLGIRAGRRHLLRRAEWGAQEAVRHALGDAGRLGQRLRAVRALGAVARCRDRHCLGRPHRRDTCLPYRA